MTRLNLLFAVQIAAILAALGGELLGSQPLVAVAVGTFAVAVVATFAQMTGELLVGLTSVRIPDTAERRR
ncbi:hypothetical protein [Halobellus limi]|jgi:hypothetical protein|uniref:Uncharacterized protein n=1 Tax=Halobellus limi TaxID=699433 RepID=A0A1H6BCL9_9EURY|nr:hypothetical protein [Halobellus limi]QCC49239.1 hypothetical protein DV707_15935 [Halobellus limi]SEG57946.1 hypothetical protein SAMN04488133_2713 [Halobellus limi]